MRAARFHGFGSPVQIDEIADPEPAEDEVGIRVHCCQIGGDILKIMAGAGPVRGRETFDFPHTPGYRGAGTVDALGSAVEGLAIGDRVAINGFLNCGSCEYCQVGLDNLCERSHMLGVDSGLPGAMAERITVPARTAYELPDDIPFELATLLPNVALLVHAYGRAGLGEGPFSTAIFGCGLVGSTGIAVAKALGAEQIIGVDTAATARAFALECGATATVDPDGGGDVDRVMELTEGRGVDVAVECVGLGFTIAGAVQSTRPRGVALLIGALGETTITFVDYYRDVIQREVDLRACFGKTQADFSRAVELAGTGGLDLSEFPVRVHSAEDLTSAIDVARDSANTDVHVVTWSEANQPGGPHEQQ